MVFRISDILKAVPAALKKELEKTTVFVGLPKVRIPLSIKAAVGTVALFPTRALTLIRAVPKAVLPITFKKAAIAVTGIGILQVSPKAREFIVEKIKDPTRVGREIGAIIEDPSKLQPETGKTTIEKIKEVAKAAGVVGGVAAAAAAVTAAVKKRREKAAEIPSAAPFTAMPTLPSLEPIGVAEKAPVEEPVVAVPAMPDIINKISVKPEINVRVSQTRKFINQQIFAR